MKIPVYNIKGEKVETMDIPAGLFEVAVKPEVVKQAVVAVAANQRAPYAHTKGRSEKRGGGKKPWRQKGTGRARHGSIRSPLWVGGGVTFGPTKERNFTQKVNKKVRRLALAMMLSEKVRHDALVVVDDLNMPEIKTKKLVEMLQALPHNAMSTLVLLPESQEVIVKSAANIPKTDTGLVANINAHMLAQHQRIVMSKSALQKLVEHFA